MWPLAAKDRDGQSYHTLCTWLGESFEMSYYVRGMCFLRENAAVYAASYGDRQAGLDRPIARVIVVVAVVVLASCCCCSSSCQRGVRQ